MNVLRNIPEARRVSFSAYEGRLFQRGINRFIRLRRQEIAAFIARLDFAAHKNVKLVVEIGCRRKSSTSSEAAPDTGFMPMCCIS